MFCFVLFCFVLFSILVFWTLGKMENAFSFFQGKKELLLYKSLNSYLKRKLHLTSSAYVLLTIVAKIFFFKASLGYKLVHFDHGRKIHFLKEKKKRIIFQEGFLNAFERGMK